MIEPQEDPHDTRDTVIYDELVTHQTHVRRDELWPDTCRICRRELDMIRGG